MQKLQLKKEYQKYPEYKDSRLDWLGEIPKDWNVDKLKAGFNFEKGKNAGLFTQEYVGSEENIGEFPVYSGQTGSNGIMGRINKYVYDFGNDGAIFSTTVGAKVMTPMLLKGKFSLSQNCVLFINKNKELNNTFFYYQLFPLFKRQKDDIPSHMQPSLRISDLNRYSVAFPPKQDQQKIAEFLDDKVELIDRIVQKKKQLIDLLKEKRTAVISQAVTKGLDPDAEMKDSGVEWIGEVPKDWDIKKLKFITQINKRTLSEGTAPDKIMEYLDISNVGTGMIKNEPLEIMFKDAPSRARRLVKMGSTILATVRTYLRAIAFFEKPSENLVVSTGFAVFDADKKIIKSKFLYYFALSEIFVSNVVAHSTGVSYPAIAPTTLGKLPIFIPTLNEQEKIVELLNDETRKVEIFSNKVKESINLLNEFKSSLISNAVTGKINIP